MGISAKIKVRSTGMRFEKLLLDRTGRKGRPGPFEVGGQSRRDHGGGICRAGQTVSMHVLAMKTSGCDKNRKHTFRPR